MEEKLTNMSFKKAAAVLGGLALVLVLVMIVPMLFTPKTEEKSVPTTQPALNSSALPTAIPSPNIKREISSSLLRLSYPEGWISEEHPVQGGGQQYKVYPINNKKKYNDIFIEVVPASVVSLDTKNKGLTQQAKANVRTTKFGQQVTQFTIEYAIGEFAQLPIYEQYYTFQYKNYIYTIGYEYENETRDVSLEKQFEGILSNIKLP